jgi:hypothetical protein
MKINIEDFQEHISINSEKFHTYATKYTPDIKLTSSKLGTPNTKLKYNQLGDYKVEVNGINIYYGKSQLKAVNYYNEPKLTYQRTLNLKEVSQKIDEWRETKPSVTLSGFLGWTSDEFLEWEKDMSNMPS